MIGDFFFEEKQLLKRDDQELCEKELFFYLSKALSIRFDFYFLTLLFSHFHGKRKKLIIIFLSVLSFKRSNTKTAVALIYTLTLLLLLLLPDLDESQLVLRQASLA